MSWTRDPHQDALIEAAHRLGVEVVDLGPALGMDLVEYRYGGRRERVWKGRVFSHLHAVAQRLCDDKHACKAVLAAVGVPVPEGLRYTDPADPSLPALLARGGRWVHKPLAGTHGEGVVLGVCDLADVERARALTRPGVFVLERQIEGRDLRLQAVGGELLAACRREPAAVLGDGRSTVEQLIASRRAQVRAANPRNDLVVDDAARSLLHAQGYTLESVPADGVQVALRRTANMAEGARAVDLTDEVHPGWAALVERIGAALGLTLFAVDAVALDPRQPPDVQGAVIEVNARPEWLHHTFSDGRQHDVPRHLLEHLFHLR